MIGRVFVATHFPRFCNLKFAKLSTYVVN